MSITDPNNRKEHNDDANAKKVVLYGLDEAGNYNPVHVDYNGDIMVAFGGPSNDAFGRGRVSEPQTIFDSKQIFDNGPLFWDDQEVSGSGTSSTHSADEASSALTVSATTAGKRVRQTFMRFNYQPGKSQLVMMTGILGMGTSGITQGIGIFDDNNGLFFKCEDGTLNATRRTSVTGSPVDTDVAQSAWNIDKLDGTGCRGITLDFTKTQIFIFDYEWLGVGRVRMGLVHNGIITYCHEFLNSNVLDKVYMSTPNLPLRYEIENDGTAASTTLTSICGTVISEGGSEDTGALRYKSTAGTHVDCAAVNTIYAIVGIRLKSTHLAASVKIQRIALQIQTQSETGEWIWMLNPTVADTFTYANETNSAVQTATGATANTVTGGTRITGGYAVSTSGGGGSGGVASPVPNAILLGSAIDGTPDEMVLCWMPTTGADQDIEGSITWRELS